jgi:hypothetical protein
MSARDNKTSAWDNAAFVSVVPNAANWANEVEEEEEEE